MTTSRGSVDGHVCIVATPQKRNAVQRPKEVNSGRINPAYVHSPIGQQNYPQNTHKRSSFVNPEPKPAGSACMTRMAYRHIARTTADCSRQCMRRRWLGVLMQGTYARASGG